jgi:hypothetical protein
MVKPASTTSYPYSPRREGVYRMSQDSKAQATVCVGKTKVVLALPIEVCNHSAVCKKDGFSARLSLLGVNDPDSIEPLLSKCFEICDDFVNLAKLGKHSIELPYIRHVPHKQRKGTGEQLRDILEPDYEVEVMVLDEQQRIQASPIFA